MQNDETNQVAPLGDLDDFQVAEGYPDVRGWDVLASDGQKVGEVHELIVDTASMRTRYLDVRLDKDLAASGDDREILVPIGSARVDESDDRILLDSMTASQVIALPAYDKDAFSRDYETSLLPNFDAGAVDMTNGGDSGAAIGASEGGIDRTRSRDFYDTRHFDDSRFFSGRTRRAAAADAADMDADTSDEGEARVTRSEDVMIERRPPGRTDDEQRGR